MPLPEHEQQPVVTMAEIPLPVEPLWTLESAAVLLLMSGPALKNWLRKHKDDLQIGPKLYQGSPGRRRRLLRSSEVQYIRSVLVSTVWRSPQWGSSATKRKRLASQHEVQLRQRPGAES
jgi:hypothetical protein